MPLPRITIRSLQALLAVYEEQSFSRAAERENATQSGMSTQVKKLETLLGTPLLTRGKGTLDLTPAGEIVYERGRHILKALFELEEKLDSLDRSVSGSIRVGVIPTLTRAVLPRALGRFRAAYPDVEVSVIEEYSFSLMRRVAMGELDWAAVPAGDLLSGLKATYLASDTEVLAVPPGALPDHPNLSPVKPGELTGLNLILPSSINVRRRGLEQYFSSHGVEPGEVMDMDAMLGTLELIAGGDWCAILPAAICHNDLAGDRRKLHPLVDPPIRTDYVIVHKAEKALSRAADLLFEDLKSAAMELRQDWDLTIEGRT
ncbi:MAG: LysR family transcriptional regulator [Silicimonas sp.]